MSSDSAGGLQERKQIGQLLAREQFAVAGRHEGDRAWLDLGDVRARNAHVGPGDGPEDDFVWRLAAQDAAVGRSGARAPRDRLEAAGEMQLSSDLTERFITDMDGSLREIGISDQVVGKHIGNMVSALGGRLGAYREAFATDAPAGFADLGFRH